MHSLAKVASLICIGACVVVVAVYCYWIVADPAWFFGDDEIVVKTIASGTPLLLYLSPQSGRFFPLMISDQNVLLWAGNRPIYFLGYSALRLIGISVLFGFALKRVNPASWPVFLLGFLLLDNVIYVHLNSSFPESMMMINFCGFALAYMKALETRDKKYLLIAAIFSLIATYEKESVFVLFTAIAISGLALHSREDRKLMKPLHVFLFINALLFLILYYFLTYRHVVSFYNVGQRDSFFQTLIPMFRYDRPMILFLLLGLLRIFYLIRGDRTNVASDIFLFAGIAFVAVYIALRMYKPYNMIPAYIFLILAFAGYCRRFSVFTTIVAAILISLILTASPRILERKNLIHRLREDQIEISNLLATYSRSGFKLFYLTTKEPKQLRRQNFRVLVLNTIPKSQYPEIPTIQVIDGTPSTKAVMITGPESKLPDSSWTLLKSTYEYKLYSTQ